MKATAISVKTRDLVKSLGVHCLLELWGSALGIKPWLSRNLNHVWCRHMHSSYSSCCRAFLISDHDIEMRSMQADEQYLLVLRSSALDLRPWLCHLLDNVRGICLLRLLCPVCFSLCLLVVERSCQRSDFQRTEASLFNEVILSSRLLRRF